MAAVSLVCRPAGVLPKLSGTSWQVLLAAGPVTVQQRKIHHAVIPKGKGGRSSVSGISATVFGATGYLGRYVVNRLGRIGTQVVIPHRCDEYDTMHLRLMGDLGQMIFLEWDPKDPESTRRAVAHSNVVINLVGKEWETNNCKFDDLFVKIPKEIAKATREAGIKKLIHMSHLNADFSSPSKYLRQKAVGEIEVREEFPDAIIMKPSEMFGRGDDFVTHFASKYITTSSCCYNLFCLVIDVAQAIINAIHDPETNGKTYVLVGPNRYLLGDFVRYIFLVAHRPLVMYSLPRPLLLLLARFFEWNPFRPWTTRDKVIRFHTTDKKFPDLPGLEDLGITPTPFEQKAIEMLRYLRRFKYHAASVDNTACKTTDL
ncbi:hypothetical protein DNTS_033419 [Danionella cerebrum]|uniref:NADH dehydrogenase [ubiquinone] 1 alpha subcomplex subunit 9, mitochondrial n=1 Tax=Danionella cerebrum TaxID=2873325 RepID=A0A553MMZ9_9TELE|nr:hypothetical protein DNTS_033419 [Danionella translucida]